MKIKDKQFDLSYLDDEEKKLMEAVERGEFEDVGDLEKTKKELQEIAQKSLKKRAVSVQLPEKDIQLIKSMAEEEGISYQTLIASIIHRYAGGTLKSD